MKGTVLTNKSIGASSEKGSEDFNLCKHTEAKCAYCIRTLWPYRSYLKVFSLVKLKQVQVPG